MKVPQITLLHDILNQVLHDNAEAIVRSGDDGFLNDLINMLVFDMCKVWALYSQRRIHTLPFFCAG